MQQQFSHRRNARCRWVRLRFELVNSFTARASHPLQSPSVDAHGKSRRGRAPMTMFVFAALIVTAVIAITWGTTAVALRQPHKNR